MVGEALGGPSAGPVDHSPEDSAISTTGLTKVFRSHGGKQVAVDHLELVVPRGCVYGFLGPNGSGKTTTIRMLLGLISPTEGTHTLLGQPMPRYAGSVLPRVGALVEGPAFHPHLTGWANLERLDAADRTARASTARARIGGALERVGLQVAARKKYRAYSLGMRQRLGIAAALLQPRDLLVLDEPTNGLDPQGTREVRALVAGLACDGTTVLLSSHLLSEVEQVCTRVGVMRAGRLVAQGPIGELRGREAVRIRVETSACDQAAESLRRQGLAAVVVRDDEVTAELGGHEPEQVCAVLVADGVPVRGFGVVRPDLEDVFVSLTGEGFDVSG